jgi:elongation factor Ts
VVQTYVHAGNKVAAVVVLACETDFVAKNEEFVKLAYDIAMHTAAMAPQFLSKKQITEEDTRAAREVFMKEAEDKSEEMREKIVAGKLDKHLSELVLLDQPFVKDPSVTITDLLTQATQKFGEKIEVVNFGRFAI